MRFLQNTLQMTVVWPNVLSCPYCFFYLICWQPSMFFRYVTDTNQSESHSGHQQLRFTRNYMWDWRTWRRPPTSSLLLDLSCKRTIRGRRFIRNDSSLSSLEQIPCILNRQKNNVYFDMTYIKSWFRSRYETNTILRLYSTDLTLTYYVIT